MARLRKAELATAGVVLLCHFLMDRFRYAEGETVNQTNECSLKLCDPKIWDITVYLDARKKKYPLQEKKIIEEFPNCDQLINMI